MNGADKIRDFEIRDYFYHSKKNTKRNSTNTKSFVFRFDRENNRILVFFVFLVYDERRP